MKATDLRPKTTDELKDELGNLRKEAFNLRFQKASGQLQKTARARQVRRDIARIKTVLGEKAARRKEHDMPKRVLQGVVVSDKMDKTIVVQVDRRVHASDLQEVHPPLEEVRGARRGQASGQGRRHRAHPGVPPDVQAQELGSSGRRRQGLAERSNSHDPDARPTSRSPTIPAPAGCSASRCWAARSRKYATVGDVIVVSIKEAIPRGRVKKGDVHRR